MRTAGESGANRLCLSVARGRVLARGVLWGVGAVLVGFGIVTVVSGLDFKPTAVSNRLVEYSIAAVLIPFAAGAIWSAVTATRWMLLGAWPGTVGVFTEEDALVLKLGPYGTQRYEWDVLDVRYWFEHDPEEFEGLVEAFLPEEEQRARFLPQIRYPGESAPINRMLLHRTGRSEQEAADALRDAFASRRRNRGERSPATEDEEGTPT